ncbi:MAG: hypothetical protein J6Z50_07245 [Fibrobacterales bacterium]|nr:hypothetical protein [Fibrobacterales bacterium]MBP5188909.1 hypothetical protein [Fibrobacterales bacterium]
MAKKAFLFAIAFAAFCAVSCSDGGSSGGSGGKDSAQAEIQKAYEYTVEFVAGIVEYRTVYLEGGVPDKRHSFNVEQCGRDTACIDSLVRVVIDEKLAGYGIKADCALDTNCLLAWRDSMTTASEEWEDDGGDDGYQQSCHFTNELAGTCEEYAWYLFGSQGAIDAATACQDAAAEGGRCQKTKCRLSLEESEMDAMHATYALDKALCPDKSLDRSLHMDFAEGIMCYESFYNSSNSMAVNSANTMLANGYEEGPCGGQYSVVCEATVQNVEKQIRNQVRVTPNNTNLCATSAAPLEE